MPNFSAVVKTARAGTVPGGKIASIDPTVVMIQGKELGFQLLSGTMADPVETDVAFPQLACLCGQSCNLDVAKAFGNVKGVEILSLYKFIIF